MKFYTRRRRMPTVIIVSLIDIFVILLIFVIVTTTFKTDHTQQKIHLPEAGQGAAEQAPAEPITLTITSDDKMTLDDKPVAPEELKAALVQLLEKSPDRPLAINSDTKASFGYVFKVMNVLKEAGVKDIPVLTEKK